MKIIRYVFVLLFLTIITLPLVFMDTKSTISEIENRTLATFPNMIKGRKINKNAILHFPKLLDDYLNDRVGFKKEAVSVINTIKVSGTSIQGNVVLGKNDWLFYASPGDGNNLGDFQKTNLFSRNEIRRFMSNIEDRAKWCNDNNIKFIFLIAPNKHSIYPEYYPMERPAGITRTEQIMNALPDNLKDVVIYPRDYFLSKKATSDLELYYKTDTHWNMLGAYYASELILQKMQTFFPRTEFPQINYSQKIITDSVHTDLPGMLGTASKYTDRAIFIEPEQGWESYYKYITPIGLKSHDFLIGHIGTVGIDGMIAVNTNENLPTAIVFRDSFGSAL
jgi:hypothetical protein